MCSLPQVVHRYMWQMSQYKRGPRFSHSWHGHTSWAQLRGSITFMGLLYCNSETKNTNSKRFICIKRVFFKRRMYVNEENFVSTGEHIGHILIVFIFQKSWNQQMIQKDLYIGIREFHLSRIPEDGVYHYSSEYRQTWRRHEQRNRHRNPETVMGSAWIICKNHASHIWTGALMVYFWNHEEHC